MNDLPVPWQNELSPPARDYLAGLLDFVALAPASARPATLTVAPAPSALPPPPAAAALIEAAAAGKAGLVHTVIDERPYPLWLRAGTDDAAAAIKSLDRRSVPKIPYAPRRILEIGAGAGYRSVALAMAYPGADILTTEPDAACQRVALLNTMPYRIISCLFVTVSTDNARYAFTGRQGEAGMLALGRNDNGDIAAQQLKNVLYGRNWNSLDTVVISLDAASDHLMRAPWPPSIRLIAVQNGGRPLHSATAICFPDEQFLTVIEGDYVLLHRREVEHAAPPPRLVPVFDTEGPEQSLSFQHVATRPPGFFALGPHGFRLHPNGPDSPAARLTVAAICRQFKELRLVLRVAQATARPVRFTVHVTAIPGGNKILATAQILKGGETRSIAMPMEGYDGSCDVSFTTEMAEFGDSNKDAWAEIVAAAFV